MWSAEEAAEGKASLQPQFIVFWDYATTLIPKYSLSLKVLFNKCGDFLKSLLTCPTVDLKNIFAKGKKSIPSLGSPEVEISSG